MCGEWQPILPSRWFPLKVEHEIKILSAWNMLPPTLQLVNATHTSDLSSNISFSRKPSLILSTIPNHHHQTRTGPSYGWPYLGVICLHTLRAGVSLVYVWLHESWDHVELLTVAASVCLMVDAQKYLLNE